MVAKRIKALMVAVGLTLSLLIAPMTQGSAAGADPCTTTLKIWTFGDVIEPLMVRKYKTLHPEVCLDIKKSDLDPLNGTALVTACAAANAHTGADIAAIEISYSGYWRSYPQCFVDLKTMHATGSNKSATEMKADYLPWRWANGVAYNNNVIGIPTDVGGLQVAYRWDLLKAKGMPYKRADVSKAWSSWDKFIAFGKTYMSKLSPAEKKDKAAFMDNAGAIYTAMINQGTEKYYRNDGTPNGQLIYSTNPQIKKAYNTTVTALQAGIGARIAQFSSDWNVGMNKNKFAVMLSPAWMMDYIKQQAEGTAGKWDIANIPGGGGNQGGTQLSIPTSGNPANRQAAWDFISWYLAPAQQKLVFTTYGLFPSTPSLYKDPEVVGFKDPFFNNAPVGQIYAAGVQKLKPIFEGKKQRAIDNAIGAALTRVDTKKMTPAASWTKAMSEIKAAVG